MTRIWSSLPTWAIVFLAAGPAVLFVPEQIRPVVIIVGIGGWILGYALLRVVRSGLLSDASWRRPSRHALLLPWRVGSREYVVPAELPPPPALMLGRDADVDNIVEYVTRSADGRRVVLIVGPDGVGKSALALGVAQLLADRYRDGQLLARLDRAMGEEGMKDVLRMFVTALAKPTDVAPRDDLAHLERRYRELTSGGRRVLVILDAATSATQVERLLPAGRGCAALITARQAFGDDSRWHRVQITGLDGPAALGVLDALVGDGRVGADPAAANRIVRAAAGNPFALQLAGLALATRRHWTLAAALARMADVRLPADRRRKLPAFAAALDLGFALLTAPERRGLVLLGLVEESSFARWTLGALVRGAGGPGDDRLTAVEADSFAERILDRLVRLRFLDRKVDDASGVSTYRIPEQIRPYVQARMLADLDADVRRRAADELTRERRHRGDLSADELLRNRVYHSLQAGELAAALTTAREALALCQERQQQTRGHEEHDQARADLSRALAALAEVQGELGWLEEARRYAEQALSLAVPRSRPRALRCLGLVHRRLHRPELASSTLAEAYEAATLIDDLGERIRTLRDRALAQAMCEEHEPARQTLAHAMQLCDASGPAARRRRSTVLWAKGVVLLDLQRADEADDALAEAEAICLAQAPALNIWIPWIRHQRSLVALAKNQPGRAHELARRAGEGFRDMQHRYGIGHCRLVICRALVAEHSYDAAIPGMEEALQTFVGCGDRWAEAQTRLTLAETLHAAALNDEVAAALRLGDARGLSDRVAQDFDDLDYPPGRRAARALRAAVERDQRRPSADRWSWPLSLQPATVLGRGRAGAPVR